MQFTVTRMKLEAILLCERKEIKNYIPHVGLKDILKEGT